MEFRTKVNIQKAPFAILPCERVLFVGSCFANNIGQKFADEKFRTVINPFGTMYNPASILHTIERMDETFDTAVITLGTNHVYIEKASGEIVDNCKKRPQRLFIEKELTIDECVAYLKSAINLLLQRNEHTKFILTVSPIRYAKYGFHKSQLSKATLLLAVNEVVKAYPTHAAYFPAYEIVNDELRDYRFYKADMLHPNEQAVDYIWECLVEEWFSDEAKKFLSAWKPIKEALSHRPFDANSEEYKAFRNRTLAQAKALSEVYKGLIISEE